MVQRETGLVGQIEQMEKQMQKYVQVQGDQLNMVVFFWHLVKGDLSSIRYRTLDKSLFTRYPKNTVIFNWSPCTKKAHSIM